MKITSGIIAGTVAATAIGIMVKSMRKPKSKLQKNTARTLNTISSVTHSLANMIG
jgi:hypothetical protein